MPDPLLKQLREIFTEDEANLLFERCKQMKAEGFGRVVIQFKNGHPDILERRITERFPQPARTYTAE